MTGTRRAGGFDWLTSPTTSTVVACRSGGREEKARALSRSFGGRGVLPGIPVRSDRRLPLCNLCATPPGKPGDDGGRVGPKNSLRASHFHSRSVPSGSLSKLEVAGSSPVVRSPVSPVGGHPP